MPTEKKRLRFDFIQRIVSMDKETGRFQAELIPNPERYELVKKDGKNLYFDKFDKFLIDLETIARSFKDKIGMPIYYSPPKQQDYKILMLSRVDEIRAFLAQKEQQYAFIDKSEEFLSKLVENDQRNYVILSIDLKGSTKLSQEIDHKEYVRLIQLFIREMAVLTENFNGLVLKYTGDGLISYFPEPNFVGMNDNAVSCAHLMKHFILKILNPILIENKLPPIKFRIGLDSGEATAAIVGFSRIKQHKDLLGATINVATKIQGLAKENGICLGESTALNVHTSWRKIIGEIEIPKDKDWPYVDSESGKPYMVFELSD